MYVSAFGNVQYRSLWKRGAPGSTIEAALPHWMAWINRSRQQHEIDLTRTGRHHLSARTWLVVAHEHTDTGRAAALASITFRQQTLRVTCSTAIEGPEHGWLQTLVCKAAPILDNKIYAPGFEAALRDELGAMDGAHPLPEDTTTPAPRPALTEVLADPDRLLPVVLILPPREGASQLWRGLHQDLFFQLRGMCTTYVLEAGEQQEVAAWLPDMPLRENQALVVPPLPVLDAGTEKITDLWFDEHAHIDLSKRVRHHAVQAHPPEPVRCLMRQVQEQLAHLTPWPQLAEFHEEGHRQRADRLQTDLHNATAELKRLKRERSFEADLFHLRGERDQALDELAQARSENTWLRQQAAAQGLHQLAGARPPRQRTRRTPERVPDLLEAITDADALPYLHMSLDERAVHELAHDGQERLWVARAWEALGALNDWARYHHEQPGNGLGLHDYLKHAPPGYRAIPDGRFSASESATVRRHKKLRAQREFAVPTDVDPSGKAPMYAHIRLENTRGICPRLHFLPDMARPRPRLFIGYLGPHLQVATTN